MKKILYMMALVWIGIGMMSCEKKLEDYHGEEGVYFFVQWGNEWGDTTKWASQSYTPVEFVGIVGSMYDVKIRVMTTGKVKEYDRTFHMIVDKDTTTAVVDLNYEPFEEMQVVKAGTAYTDVTIHLKRNVNIAKEEKVLGLRLLPSDDFTLSLPVWGKLSDLWLADGGDVFDACVHKIIMNDFVTRPPRWAPLIDYKPGDREGGLWGAFSQKKYRLICDKFNLSYEDFLTEASMPSAKRTVIKEYMVKYLQNLYDKGTPVLEDDGRLMWFMGVSWSSIIGVPWVSEQ